MDKQAAVISLGGSLLCPAQLDEQFVRDFSQLIIRKLQQDAQRQFIITVGGGNLAREYQQAYTRLHSGAEEEVADWIGIQATRLHAQLLQGVFSRYVRGEVLTDPRKVQGLSHPIQIAAGWKPGFSTDLVTVLLAQQLKSSLVINLSNIPYLYEEDPKKNPNAEKLCQIGWKGFRKIVGEKWMPGQHAPFDPVASEKAMELGLRVIIADGRNLDNLEAILEDRPFIGTTISPEEN